MKTLRFALFGIFTSLLLAVMATHVQAQTTWAGPGTDVNTPGNWNSGLPSSTVDAHFAGSGPTNPTQSAAITIRDMIFDSGAPSYTYGVNTGQLTLLNPATANGVQAPNALENNSVATQVIGGTGAAIGIAGTINAAAGDIVINGAINVGNGVAPDTTTASRHYIALSGSHDVYFNVDPALQGSGNLSGGAWTSSVTAGMYTRQRGRFYLGQTFSGRAYLGDIGTSYQGTFHLNSTQDGALRLTNNNSLGNPNTDLLSNPTVITAIDIYGGTTNNGTLELKPATGTGISVIRSAIWMDGRSGAVAEDPHILNVDGDNTLRFTLDWNTGVRGPFGTTSESTAAANNPFNPGNWNIKSDAGTLTIAGNTVETNGVMYNTRNAAINLQLMGAGNGVISAPINKNGANPTLAIVKKGTGTWTLTNANLDADGAAAGATYDGNVTVREGTLALSGSGSLANSPSLTIRNGSTFNVSGVTGGVFTLNTLNGSNLVAKGNGTISGAVTTGTSNVTIQPGDTGDVGDTAIGTFHFGNSLVLNGSNTTLALELTSTPGVNDKVAVAGDLTLNGSTNVPLTFVNGNLGNGTYTLLSYGGTLTGDLSNLNITGLPPTSPRQSFVPTSNTGAKQINLVVTGTAANLTWVGGVNGNVWVDGGVEPNSINWTGHPTDNHFFDADNVTFGSSATTFTPNVQGTVSPGSVTFSNGSGANYTISGGTISAVGPATFNNAGSVTFTNAATSLSSMNATGSGDVSFNAGNLTVVNTFTVATTGTGKVTIANPGGTISLPGTLNLTSGKLALNRSDVDIPVTSTVTGAGAFDKDGTNLVTVSADNTGFTGTVNVKNGTLRADGNATATYKPLGTANITVSSGATLAIFKNGTTTSGTGELNVTIAGNGVAGRGALISADLNNLTNGGNANAHVRSITLSDDARIGAIGGVTSATRSILWVDGPGAFIQGNGKNLSVNIDNGLGIAFTEMDWINVGDTNLKNIEVSGGGVLYSGGNTSFGPLTGDAMITLQNKGRLGFYTTGANASTGTIDKPISVAKTTLGGGIEFFGSGGSKTIASPIKLNGNLDVSFLVNGAANVLTWTQAGAITDATGADGPRSLTVHTGTETTTATNGGAGVLELVSDGNTYTGPTTIGGSGGFEEATLVGDKSFVSIGNGGGTGSIGPGDISITSPSATAAAGLILNRTGAYTLANNIAMNGGAAEVRAIGGGVATLSGPVSGAGNVVVNSIGGGLTLSATNSYSGTTTVTSGTLLVNGDNSGATSDVTVGATGILGGTGTIGGNVLMQADGSTFTTAFSGGTIDPLAILGNLDLSATSNLLTVTGAHVGTSWVIASYSGTLTGTFESISPGYSVNYGTLNNSVITLNFIGLPGDYNNDNTDDAKDYVLWRKNPGAHGGDPAGYNAWRQAFGATAGSGSGTSLAAAVPEPTSTLLLAIMVGVMFAGCRRHFKYKRQIG
jgi:fibronectin-binding autotransporter adhesin